MGRAPVPDRLDPVPPGKDRVETLPRTGVFPGVANAEGKTRSVPHHSLSGVPIRRLSHLPPFPRRDSRSRDQPVLLPAMREALRVRGRPGREPVRRIGEKSQIMTTVGSGMAEGGGGPIKIDPAPGQPVVRGCFPSGFRLLEWATQNPRTCSFRVL